MGREEITAGGSQPAGRLQIAVIGSGISGLSAAWLLSRRHDVTLYEAADRLGGHTNTLDAPRREGGSVPVDTGFIVYNEANYPNFVALMDHLGVATRPSDMSFAVSLRGGALEYGSTNLASLFAQKRNLVRPRFLSMMYDLQRFYRSAPAALAAVDETVTLGDYLDRHRYGDAFQNDHLLPQAAAIWSATVDSIRRYPLSSFVRFFLNHGLLDLDVAARPQWRTVVGGSRSYLGPLTSTFAHKIRLRCPVASVTRSANGVSVKAVGEESARYDHVVLAAHAPQALAMLSDPTDGERETLGALRYTPNLAVLHTDVDLMPRRRQTWSAWNYVSGEDGRGEVTYWMNRLQGIAGPEQFLVSLNPPKPPQPQTVIAAIPYEHPVFDVPALAAQRRLWSLQGVRRTWYCGAYFGSGFHEDGLQSGLAVAERLGGVRRPWSVLQESDRIFITPDAAEAA